MGVSAPPAPDLMPTLLMTKATRPDSLMPLSVLTASSATIFVSIPPVPR
jgi:hypothetical protein